MLKLDFHIQLHSSVKAPAQEGRAELALFQVDPTTHTPWKVYFSAVAENFGLFDFLY